METITEQIEARFWSYVDIRGMDECWPWKRARSKKNYGRFAIKYRVVNAQRVAYVLANGPFDESLFILHSCDNPCCQNPNHLRVGTNKENHEEKMAKGRQGAAHGERSGRAKLKTNQVLEMRKIFAAGGVTKAQIAKMFSIAAITVSNIINRKRWSHI